MNPGARTATSRLDNADEFSVVVFHFCKLNMFSNAELFETRYSVNALLLPVSIDDHVMALRFAPMSIPRIVRIDHSFMTIFMLYAEIYFQQAPNILSNPYRIGALVERYLHRFTDWVHPVLTRCNFSPLRKHHHHCPWMRRYAAATGSGSRTFSEKSVLHQLKILPVRSTRSTVQLIACW